MDKHSLRDASLPQPLQSDSRGKQFWDGINSQLSSPPAAAAPKRDLETEWSDYPKAVGAGALDLVGGIGELARQASNFGKENAGKQGGDYLEQARANMANKLSPLLDVVAGAGDLAASGAESLNDGMSADAKEALGRRLVDETPEGRLTLGDGAGDIDVWAMKMAQGVGSLLPTLAAGGVTGVAAKASIGRAVTASMVKRGATQEVAEAVAAKAVSKIATGAAVTTGATGSVGSAGVNTRDTVLGMSFDELAASDTFRQSFTRIDQDQQTAHLSDEEKLGLAREETANLASRATMSDAKTWGAAAMGSMMGDAMLFKMLAGKAATGGVLKGAAKGAAGEGISETLEEGVQQYAVNESLNEVAAADIDPMKGVMSSAIEGGLIGMGTGGAVGAVGGARGGKHASQEDGVGTDPVAEPSAPVTEGAAGPAVDPNFASVPLEDGEQAPSASQAEGDLNPLGPSGSQFDELRDVPAYLRQDDTADRFKGMAQDSDVQRALAGEYGRSVQDLVTAQMQAGDQGKSLYELAQAGDLGVDPFAGNKSAQQVAMENQRPALPLKDVIFAGDANAKPVGEAVAAPGDHDDQQAGPGPQFRGGERTRWQNGQEGDLLPPEAATAHPAVELPGAVIDGEAREVGTELPHRDVVYGADQRQPDAKPMRGSATESAVGPLQTLRITRKGKPFATEKEAAMASRKGQEMPVPLNGGGFGVAEIAEVEQVKAAATTQSSAPQLDDISVTNPNQPSDQPAASVSAETVPAPSATAGEASQLAPAIDTGYREVIPGNQPQAEVSNEPVTPIPAISSERSGDQPGAGDPVATSVGPTPAELAERAGPGDPADGTSLAPVPVTQPGEENSLTAPAPAGVAVSEEAQAEQARTTAGPAAAPTPWSEMIDNPDGTITLKGEVPIIKQWAKDNGVKAIPGKGGLVVAKSFTAKVRGLTAPAANEPSALVEAARGGVVPEPTEVDLIDRDLLKEHAGRWKYRSAVGAGWFTSNTKEGAIDRAREAYRRAFEKGDPVPTREERWEQSEREFAGRMDNRFGGMTINELEKRHQNLGGTIADLQLAGRHEMNGNGGRRTGAAVANEGARQAGQEKMDLERYIQLRRDREEMAGSAPARMIEAARSEVAPEPTEAQKEAGNYKKGHLTLQGLDIALENPKGSTRSGIDPDGKEWQSTMAHDYGYIKRTLGADGDHVDVFIGDKPDSETVYVVDQVDPKTGKFDEHKVMMGFADEQAARAGYLGNYEEGWQGLGAIKAMPVEDFKRWVKEGDTTKPVAKKVRMSQQREGLSADDVAQIVSDFRREYKGAQSLDFIVGQTQEDLYGPEGSPEQIGWRDGGYLPGKQQVHLIADSITRRAGRQGVHEGAGGERGVSGDPRLLQQNRPAPRNEQGMGGVERAKAEVVSTLRHEVLGHYGLDTFTPENKRALLQKLSDAKSEKWLAPAWSEISRPEMYGDKSEQHQAEEVFAHLTENELPSRTIQAWNGIKTEFSRMLRKAGLAKGPIKEHELDSLIRAVGEGIRSGKRTRQNIRTGEEVIGKQADEPAKDDKPERIIRFSKQAMAQGNKPAKHLTRKEAELVSHGWFKQYRGASGIKVQIHATQAELEGALELDAKDGLIRRAAFDDDAGTLHVAADTISDPKRMREILRHEVLAHYGLANVLGDGEYTKLMSRLIQSQKDPSMKPVWDWVNTHYADEDIGTKAEEVVAHLAELEQGAWGRGWDRVVAWVTRALRAVGFVPDGITAAETRSLIEGLGKQLQRTGQDDGGSGGKKFSQEEKPGEDTFKPYPGEAEEYRRQLGKMMASPKSGELVIEMGHTPLVLQAVGAPDLPLRITRDIVRKATNGVKHDVPMPVIEQLPELLHDPIAVFDSKTEQGAKTILIDARDASGRPIITAVHLNAKAGRIDINRIASVYGKDNSHRVLMGWVEEGLLRYAKEKQNPLGTTQGLQLPKRGSPERVYGSNILSRGDLAKDADKVRDRVTAAGHAAPSRSEQESARDDGPFPPDGLKFSQTNSAADEALQKLNLGPKPDIIDKTKASLNKLRQVDRGVVSSWVDRVIKKANTEVLDALAPIKYAEEAAGITDAADSGYVAARMATGAASTMQATMLYGLPEWKDGVIQRKAGTGEKDALLGIFADLGADLHNWLGWMAGHRAELLLAQGRENLLDAQDIAALKAQGKGKEAKFLDAKARWNRLNAATLDLAQEAGLFTKDARAEFESEWYIPFFRESDDGDVIAPFKPRGIANQNAGIKKLKGGDANTNDLLENIFTSTSKLIDASMKNMAAQKTVWNLADTGIIEVIPKPNKMDYQALANGKDRIMVKLEGEDYMIRVEDPDLYRAMTFFDRKPFGAMVNVAAKAKRLLTAGVTASPEFMLRNFLRDSLSSWAISKDGFRPVIDSIKGVKKTLAMDGSTIDVMFSGASFLGGYVNGNDPEAMADTVRKSLRRKGMTPEQIARYEKSFIRNAAHAKGVVADAWEKYSRVGEAVENGNREAVYDAAIKAGKSHAQAAFESKDLMDFSMLGAARTIQLMSQLLPFFNARVQGLGKLTRELRDNPRAIAKRAGMITAASLALLAHNWDDERYEGLPDWDKDANWHFWLGDHHWRIPKPFEIGVLFGTIPERMARALGDKDTGAQFGKAVARAIGDTFALNPIPQIAKPVVETTVNYDFFKGGPIDGPQDLNVQAEARYNEQTSLLMRELGELTGFSPKQLEHLIIGYTGTMGSYVMAAADGLIRASRPGESASWRADEIPLVKAVYRGTGPAKSTQHMEEFYRMLNEVNQLKRTVDQYRSEGLTDKARELLEEQGGILKSRRSLSRTQQQVRVVRNKIELIQRDRTMTAEEKRRRIDEMLARRNDLVYQAVNKNKANWE